MALILKEFLRSMFSNSDAKASAAEDDGVGVTEGAGAPIGRLKMSKIFKLKDQ